MKNRIKQIMSLLMLTVFITAFGAVSVQAHCDKGGCPMKMEKMIDKKMKKLTKELKLTPEQQPQVRDALKAKFEAVHTAHMEAHEKAQTARTDFQTKVKTVLTETQKASFDKLIAKHKDKGECKACADKDDND